MAYFDVRIVQERVYTRRVEADTAADAGTTLGDLVRAGQIEPDSTSISAVDVHRRGHPRQAWPPRVTRQLLDVIQVLLDTSVLAKGGETYGWRIVAASGLGGPTVYRMLERMTEAGWLTSRWAEPEPEPGKPNRRFYKLTETGEQEARAILAAHRPHV